MLRLGVVELLMKNKKEKNCNTLHEKHEMYSILLLMIETVLDILK